MVKITEKGQVTLPKKIREELDLRPGDEIDFEIVSEEARELRVKKSPSLSTLFGALSSEKSFPGRDQIRNRVGEELGEELHESSDS